MHELSLAQDILGIVKQYVPQAASPANVTVHVKVGAASGVVPDSLSFCFAAITEGTSLQGALLEIEQIPFTLECRMCQHTFESPMGIVVCPRCGRSDTQVIAGTELQVDCIDVMDEQPETS